MERAYSPQTVRLLDGAGLTDVFHSRWFVALMALLSINIICASVERFPAAWRFFSRPYLHPERHFLSGLPLREEIPLKSGGANMAGVERALERRGFRLRRAVSGESYSLFAERHRIARLGAYVVHASLLLILGGGIADGLFGFRGYMALTKGQQSSQIETGPGRTRALPFAVLCSGAGQENYPDGSPRRWWSKLSVIENGRAVKEKEIAVNDPLTWRGIRVFQSGYGQSGEVTGIALEAALKSDPKNTKSFVLHPGQTLPLDGHTSVRLAAFVPDLVIVGNRIETRSSEPNNPAIQLAVAERGKPEAKIWLFPNFPDLEHADESAWRFAFRDLEMGYFTGLQVAYEPGQWAVWAGCLLMMAGLALSFYFVHVRLWIVPVSDDRGRASLWVGASASKQREEFREKFRALVEEIREAAQAPAAQRARLDAAARDWNMGAATAPRKSH
jgi:cytochrome c biogenesis protein